jgi:enoyl-CoA hydratase/carnithine racemase
MEVAVLGEPLAVDRAYQLGLVNRVVPAPEVRSTAVALGHRLAQLAPGAVAATRRLLWTTFHEGATVSWQQLRSGSGREDPRRAAEAAEGLAAFMEKRAPRWE